MKYLSIPDFIIAHRHSSKHRGEVLQTEVCGGFFYLNIINPDKITEWVDEDESGIGTTALCPWCGLDEVIGS